MTLKYHYVTALIILTEFRLRELSLQPYQNANDSCWCCIKMKYDSLRKFRVFEISPSITLLQGLTKHQNRFWRYDHSFSFLICFFTYDQCVVLYICWENICLRRRFRTCELSLEEFSWKYGSKDGMSIEVRFVTWLFRKQCFKIWAVKESQENDRPYCDRGI